MEESGFGKVHFLLRSQLSGQKTKHYMAELHNEGIVKCKALRHGQAEQCWAAMLFFPFNGLYQPNIAKSAERE